MDGKECEEGNGPYLGCRKLRRQSELQQVIRQPLKYQEESKLPGGEDGELGHFGTQVHAWRCARSSQHLLPCLTQRILQSGRANRRIGYDDKDSTTKRKMIRKNQQRISGLAALCGKGVLAMKIIRTRG